MAHPDRPSSQSSSKASESLDTALDLTVEGLEAAKDYIVDVLSVAGVGVALNAAISILKKVQAAKSNRDALNFLHEEVTTLVNMLHRLAKAVETELPVDQYPVESGERYRTTEDAFRSAKLTKRVATLARNLQVICTDADKLLKRHPFGRILHSTGDGRVITNMKDKIAAARQAFQMENGVMIEDKITKALRDIKNAEEERILDKIPRADGAHYLSAANAMKARLQEGTRERIFESLEEWVKSQSKAAGNGTQPVRVLVGEAGTGKSTVASELAKCLKERGLLGASFFFTRGLADLNSPTKFFSTVAWQLAQSQPALRRPVVDAARQHLKTGALLSLEFQFKDLVETPLSSLTEPHPPIFVVVDGLDECTEQGPQLVPSLLRLLLSAAVRPGSPLRIFLASRPEPQYIHDVFTTSDVKPHVSVTSIQEFRNTVDRDIDLFIRARLAESETSQAWSDADPYAVSQLVGRSGGLFVYARTAVDFILADLDLRLIQARYTALLHAEQPHGLAPLDTLYRTVLDGVFPLEHRLPKLQDDLHRVLEALVALLDIDGLSPRTLEKVTGMRTIESVPILNKLRSVILFEHDNVNSQFRIIHASFREFLVDCDRAGKDLYVNAEEAHGRLAEECTSAMRSIAEESYSQGTAAAATLILQFLTDDPTLSHFRYACRYRREHLKLSGAFAQTSASRVSFGEDLPPPIAACESFYRDGGSKICDLISSTVTQVRGSLPAGSRWADALAVVETIILEKVASIRYRRRLGGINLVYEDSAAVLSS